MATHLDTRHAAQGRGGAGIDHTASETCTQCETEIAEDLILAAGPAGEQTADLGDLVAIRAASQEARDYADLAKIRCDMAALSADTTARDVRYVHAIVFLVIGAALGCVLTVFGCLAVVRIAHDSLGTSEQRVIYDTRTVEPDTGDRVSDLPGRDAEAGESDVTASSGGAEPRAHGGSR